MVILQDYLGPNVEGGICQLLLWNGFFIVFLLEIEAFPTGHPTKEAGSSVLLLFEKPVLSE